MNTKKIKHTLVVPVILPGQLIDQIPERFSTSQAWKTHLKAILAKKVTESDFIAAIKKSTLSFNKGNHTQPHQAHDRALKDRLAWPR